MVGAVWPPPMKPPQHIDEHDRSTAAALTGPVALQGGGKETAPATTDDRFGRWRPLGPLGAGQRPVGLIGHDARVAAGADQTVPTLGNEHVHTVQPQPGAEADGRTLRAHLGGARR